MPTAGATTTATIVAAVVTASFPFYAYGAWYILNAEVVTWGVLLHHLRYIGVGLTLTTVPVAGWMLPRLFTHLTGFTAIHAFLGLQAYALLVFGLTGIARIFQVKRRHDLYHDPDPTIELSALHDQMDVWRRRLRIGVFGYLGLWFLAWLVGFARFLVYYHYV